MMQQLRLSILRWKGRSICSRVVMLLLLSLVIGMVSEASANKDATPVLHAQQPDIREPTPDDAIDTAGVDATVTPTAAANASDSSGNQDDGPTSQHLIYMPMVVASASAVMALQLQGPRQVEVGEPIVLEIALDAANDIAGYELRLLYDTGVAEWSGLHQRQNGIQQAGREVMPLGAVEQSHGVTFGMFSCSMANCLTRAEPRQLRGQQGTVTLAQVKLIARQPGVLELVFDAARFVTAAGDPVEVTLPTQPLVVQVGPESETTVYSAPAPAAPTAAPTATQPASDFDLTGDGKVTHADTMEAALTWTMAHEQGDPCAAISNPDHDVNGDGCIDVADLQAIAAHYSAPDDQNAAPADAEVSMTFTVTSVQDSADAQVGDGVCATAANVCTLRAAIQEANAHSGADTITFDLPTSSGQTIALSSPLPTLNDATGPTTIDGYTQSGAQPNTDSLSSNAQIRVTLTSAGTQSVNGMIITSSGNTIRGLAFYRLRRAIWIYGSGATDNRIVGSFIGTDATGTYTATAVDYNAVGIRIDQGAAYNLIGTPDSADRNVVSGNPSHGISLYAEQTEHNHIRNNLIGLSPDGTRRLQNRKHGIDINRGAAYNLVGGTETGERNIISGNGDGDPSDFTAGIEISHDTATTRNEVIGNCFGTDVSCTSAPEWTYNSHYGLRIEDGVTNNLISDNVIGNSQAGGIRIDNFFTSGNQIVNNRIGMSLDNTPIPNDGFGVMVTYYATGNKIGPGNVISNNPIGVWIEGEASDGNTITQNAIFNNAQLGIDLSPSGGVTPNDPGDADTGPNDGLNFPDLYTATPQDVTGMACSGCTVELFVAERLTSDRGQGRFGQGKTFIGTGSADSTGQFRVGVTGVAAGEYVTATATDAAGNTSEFSQNLLVVSPSPTHTPTPTNIFLPTVYALDTFSRSVNDGWGNAETGGAYTLAGSAANFDTTGSVGTIAVPVGNGSRSATLATVAAQDVDMSVQVETDKLAAGASQIAYLSARRMNSTTEYRARLRFATNRQMLVSAESVDAGQVTLLGSERPLVDLVHTPDTPIRMRVQVQGINPTTIRIKAWADGQSEPTMWRYSATDTTSALQEPGSVGLRTYVGSSATNLPILFTFDDFEVTNDFQGPAATPTMTPTPVASAYAADTFSRTVNNGWGSAETGGSYALGGSSNARPDYDVTGSAGTMRIPAANTHRSGALTSLFVQDVDMTVQVQTDKLAVGGSLIAYLGARQVSSAAEYRARLRFTPNRQMLVSAESVEAGQATLLGSERPLVDLVHTPNTPIWVRVQMQGANPTTIRIKAWADGQLEPATWRYSVTDATSALQEPGGVSLRAYLSGAATNAPVLVSFDNFKAIPIDTNSLQNIVIDAE